MVLVALASVLLILYGMIFPPGPTSTHVFRSNFVFEIHVGGYSIPHTSPVFWGLAILILSIPFALSAGVVALILWSLKGEDRREPSSPRPESSEPKV
ncbi:hypothetical protein ACYOEI_28575 [Singulisphaera rosea]